MDTVPRSTGTVPTPGGADDRLARVLANLRMRSTFYCHAEFGDPWSLEMPAIPDSLSFHVLIAGTCWLRLPETAAARPTIVELAAGDLALVPHGAGHDLLSDPDSPRGPRVDLAAPRTTSVRATPDCATADRGGPRRSSAGSSPSTIRPHANSCGPFRPSSTSAGTRPPSPPRCARPCASSPPSSPTRGRARRPWRPGSPTSSSSRRSARG